MQTLSKDQAEAIRIGIFEAYSCLNALLTLCSSKLSENDRMEAREYIGEIVSILDSSVLSKIYKAFPELDDLK